MAVFEGQVIVFSSFHEFKISETAIQIFPKKQYSKIKGMTFNEKVETENEIFNNMFSVFAQDGHNAFYILTPKVLEDIIEFAKILNNNIYIVFIDKYMYCLLYTSTPKQLLKTTILLFFSALLMKMPQEL